MGDDGNGVEGVGGYLLGFDILTQGVNCGLSYLI